MTDIPRAVSRLLRAHVDSVEKLDILVALGSAPERTASLFDLMRLSRLPAGVTRRIVGELESSGLVTLDAHGAARLMPSRASDREAIDELLAHHEVSRESVLEALRLLDHTARE